MKPVNHHDADTEQALLGAILNEPESMWPQVADLFASDLFADARNRQLAGVLEDALRGRKPLDAQIASSMLKAKTGDGDYAFEVADGMGASPMVRSYAELLCELRAERQLTQVAKEMLSDATGSTSERIDRAASKLLAISTSRQRTGERWTKMFGRYLEGLEDELNDPDSLSTSMFPTGFQRLDEYIGGFRPGMLSVFAARPSRGKSAFAVALADNLVRRGIPVGIFWLEDDWRDFSRRLASRRARVPAVQLRHGSMLKTKDRFRTVRDALSDFGGNSMFDDTHGLTARQISHQMRVWSKEHGVRVFIADHLGEFMPDKSDSWKDRHDLAIGAAARLFRDTAKELNAAPVLFVQMNRDIDKRGDDTPRMSDIEGSKQIEQAARVLAFVSKDKNDEARRFEIKLHKNNNGADGVTIGVNWRPETMSVEDT